MEPGHACVCENVALFDESTGGFVMFYRGGWGTQVPSPALRIEPKTRNNQQAVGRATSSDGVHWTKYDGNPV
jgi:hypothetical protein